MNLNSLLPEIRAAVEAAQDKQAVDITVLKLAGLGSFAEYFLVCSGHSQPQIQAIGEEIEDRLARQGRRLTHRETVTIGEVRLTGGRHGISQKADSIDFGAYAPLSISESPKKAPTLRRAIEVDQSTSADICDRN